MRLSKRPMRVSRWSMAVMAVRRRSGGQTKALTRRPTPMPIPVSSSRETSMLSSCENPVVSTTSAVAAMVVASSSNHRKAPMTRPSVRARATDAVSSPRASPTSHASTTPTAVATTCRAPWEKVR